MKDFERNRSLKTPEDVAAEALYGELSRRDYTGDAKYLDIRELDRSAGELWRDEGFKEPLTFVDAQGHPILLIRRDDKTLLNERGLVRPEVNVQYRVYLPGETRDVTIPRRMTGKVPETALHGDVVVYDAREVDSDSEDIEWLRERFGDALKITRPPLSISRLENGTGVLAIGLENLMPLPVDDF